jgi:hypothetical protein
MSERRLQQLCLFGLMRVPCMDVMRKSVVSCSLVCEFNIWPTFNIQSVAGWLLIKVAGVATASLCGFYQAII